MEVYGNIMNEYEKSLKSMQQEFEKSKHEYEVTDIFPPKLPLGYQYLMDCRLQLLLYEDQSIHCGETKKLGTTCVISPNHGWILSTKCNPAFSLIFQEENIKPSLNKFRISVTVTNISDENINIPRGHCIGYLLMRL